MKRKSTNPNQWTLERCINFTLEALSDEDREMLRTASAKKRAEYNLHNTMGRWIRNECKLWEHGTDKVVEDIIREYKEGRLRSEYLDANQFVHPDLPFDIMKTPRTPLLVGMMYNAKNQKSRKVKTRPDNSLLHPDNCSGVIIEAVVQRIQDGC